MYYDLFIPFPIPENSSESGVGGSKNSKNKGKGKVVETTSSSINVIEDGGGGGVGKEKDCWAGLSSGDKAEVAARIALEGHLGYDVVGLTVIIKEPTNQVFSCPFASESGNGGTTSVPFPNLDPRFSSSLITATAESPTTSKVAGKNKAVMGGKLVQVSRYHYRLDDSKSHPFTASNTNALRAYDLLSVSVSSERTLQIASSDLAMPGPNQLSIITLPLHERSFHFRFNRKQIKQAIRNGVVFEILYGAGLFPPPSVSSEIARRYRQNFLSNAREVVRITGGRGLIFSSGPGGSPESPRGPQDIINLATVLGLPANLAKDAVSQTPKTVILRAQSRRTYKAILSTPRMVVSDAEQSKSAIAQDDLSNSNKTDSKKRPGGGVVGSEQSSRDSKKAKV